MRHSLKTIDWSFDGQLAPLTVSEHIRQGRLSTRIRFMDIIEQLEFKYKINKALKRGKTFDQIFEDPGFLDDFHSFLNGRIGQIWLRKENGWKFARWQQS